MTENERLKKLRKHFGFTLMEMGKKLGLSHQAISAIETGRAKLTDRNIVSICSVFPNVSETWLRTGEGEMFRPAPAADELEHAMDEMKIPEEARDIVRSFAALPPEMQTQLNVIFRQTVADAIRAQGIPLPADLQDETPEAAEAPEDVPEDIKKAAAMFEAEAFAASKRTGAEAAG